MRIGSSRQHVMISSEIQATQTGNISMLPAFYLGYFRRLYQETRGCNTHSGLGLYSSELVLHPHVFQKSDEL